MNYSYPIIKNSIFWGNTSEQINIETTEATATLSYCVVQGGYSGGTNIAIDPQLSALANNGGRQGPVQFRQTVLPLQSLSQRVVIIGMIARIQIKEDI